MEIVRKLLLRESIFPVNDYDDEVVFTFYTINSDKVSITLSLTNSLPLEDLVKKQNITYEVLAKQGIDKLNNLLSKEDQYFYRYVFYEHSEYLNLKYLIIFGFDEYRDYYNCHVFGVLVVDV